jgi:hypothetical protein
LGLAIFLIPFVLSDFLNLSLVLSADPDRVEAKTKLAEVYEITGQLQKALDLVNEGMRLIDSCYGCFHTVS